MPFATLKTPYDTDDRQLLALCIWRAAADESIEAKLAVRWVIRNRMAIAPAHGFQPTVRGTILMFPSFMQGDPDAGKYPAMWSPAWQDALLAANGKGPDWSEGAVYFNRFREPSDAWRPVTLSAQLGHLAFYRITCNPGKPVSTNP